MVITGQPKKGVVADALAQDLDLLHDQDVRKEAMMTTMMMMMMEDVVVVVRKLREEMLRIVVREESALYRILVRDRQRTKKATITGGNREAIANTRIKKY